MDDLTNQLAYREVERHRRRAVASLERVQENVAYALRDVGRHGTRDVSGYTRNVAESARNAYESVLAMDAAMDVYDIVVNGDES